MLCVVFSQINLKTTDIQT